MYGCGFYDCGLDSLCATNFNMRFIPKFPCLYKNQAFAMNQNINSQKDLLIFIFIY